MRRNKKRTAGKRGSFRRRILPAVLLAANIVSFRTGGQGGDAAIEEGIFLTRFVDWISV